MKPFFEYNWQVRREWYEWCEQLSEKELLAERTGGVGSILRTLLHIVDVEWSWIRDLQGKPNPEEDFDSFKSLAKVRALDQAYHVEVKAFVDRWDEKMEENRYVEKGGNGKVCDDTWGIVMRHIIAHEIHHIGQLSVWAREIGKEPVSANVIGRKLAASQAE
ncbi:DinB family protein [Shouchella clausii]|uniref:DinB family protein n=1 Tax=Shouchella clausii TaxID=79880 RepID=UPI000B960022|nr:DinB family protein [Shouchella clausii]AST94585.1 damage-inducible protein DinB [Shouchella clausii]MCR1289425.1 DinB family protein [Shouchella clausii]MEB5474884.1 DinB family protein [Shouchella clausii]PAD90977.1 damage-inducible protein DinB [Shouchella clausii]QNM45023.1 damage-inducible protein DinB [Shouchella clausii]